MDDELSEKNKILRNQIKELTDAIANAKSNQGWQRGKKEHYYHGNTTTYRQNLSRPSNRPPAPNFSVNAHYGAHPYVRPTHHGRKVYGKEHFNRYADRHTRPKMPYSSSSNSRPSDNELVHEPYSSIVNSQVPKPYVETRKSLKTADLSQTEFQQKVEKMKNDIAYLQKTLSERLVSSPSKQNINTVPYTPSGASEVSKEHGAYGICSSHSTLEEIKPLPRCSSEPCIAAGNMDEHLPVPFIPQNYTSSHKKSYNLANNCLSTYSGSSAKDTKHVPVRNTFYIASDTTTSDSQNSESELISLSKYKMTRLNVSPTKTSTSIPKVCSVQRNTAETSLNKDRVQSLNNICATNSGSTKSSEVTTTCRSSKYLHKSKYSLQRVKGSSKKPLSVKKTTATPTKFISLSKFAIKRVRRSLSDESRTGSTTKLPSTRHQHDWSYGGSFSKPYESYHPSYKDKKQYKYGQFHKFTQSYKTRAISGFYQKRISYKKPYYGTKGWKYGSYSNQQTYRRTDGLHRRHHSRYGYTSSYPGLHRHYTWQPSSEQTHNGYSRYVNRRIQQLKQKIPFNPKHKLDRRIVSKVDSNVNFVIINGLLYKSNSKKLVKATPVQSVQGASVKKSTAGGTNTTDRSSVSGMKNVTLKDMKTVIVRGVKFKVDKHGKSLTRITQPQLIKESCGTVPSSRSEAQISRVDIGGVTYKQTKPGTLERVHSVKSRVAAVRVVNKTIQRAAGKYIKDNTKNKKKYCMFFNRFGKCNRKEKCPYIHDPEKVAVCTRFLRGTCKSKDCPFSHKMSENKVPTCSYFVLGKCSRTECPYPHVKVNREAAVCDDFLKGFCPSGLKCKKKHILQCPEYFHTGVCSNGDTCKLQHKKKVEKKQTTKHRQEENSVSTASNTTSSETDTAPTVVDNTSVISLDTCTTSDVTSTCSVSDTPMSSTDDSTGSSPLSRKRKLPAYISLKTSNSSVSVVETNKGQKPVQNEKTTLKIRPQFGGVGERGLMKCANLTPCR